MPYFTIILQYINIPDRTGEKFSANQRPEKHKSGRGRWNVAPCQVLFNSVQRFQRGSRKCMSQSETRAATYIYSYIVPCERVFSFWRVFSIVVIYLHLPSIFHIKRVGGLSVLIRA